MVGHFCISRRNFGHWDVIAEEGRLFRLRGGPSQWDVIDERDGKGQNSSMMSFKDQSAAMSYICAELMHELLTVKGQQPHAMESWNIDFTNSRDPMGPSTTNKGNKMSNEKICQNCKHWNLEGVDTNAEQVFAPCDKGKGETAGDDKACADFKHWEG